MRDYGEVSADRWPDDPEFRRFAAAAEADMEAAYQQAFGLGDALAARRAELRMSQTDLAQKAGVPQADISRIERGKGNPTLTTLEKITSALQLRLGVQPLRAER